MASHHQPPILASSAGWRLPDSHPDGRRYVLIAGAAAFFSFFLWDFITWPLIGLTLWVAAFFRDPVRVTPQVAGEIVAPADGLVSAVERVAIPPELVGAGCLGDALLVRISIHMSIFDVHVNRTPIAGTIRQVVYISGKFLNIDLDKASDENERQHIVIEGRDGQCVGMTQIAGLVSRRIVSFVKPGDIVAAGQRLGLIRFGSRVDIYLPDGLVCQMIPGQRVVAGETVIARPGGVMPTGIAH
ncbi:MAG: phosphatidylserine decarboxylase family protein [Sphingomonas hengshuiensis]|nr:MAG: phosphatidylserine decarboxylase family protein [Sphingomonas hengshuiensis]